MIHSSKDTARDKTKPTDFRKPFPWCVGRLISANRPPFIDHLSFISLTCPRVQSSKLLICDEKLVKQQLGTTWSHPSQRFFRNMRPSHTANPVDRPGRPRCRASVGAEPRCPGRRRARRNEQVRSGPIPKDSMYSIYAYIGVVWGVNVGIYSIHGVSGIESNEDHKTDILPKALTTRVCPGPSGRV